MKKSIFSVVLAIVGIMGMGIIWTIISNGSITANAEQNHYNFVFNLGQDAAKKENYQSAKQQFSEASSIYDDKGTAKTYQTQAQLLSTAVNYFKNADLMNAKDYFNQAKTVENGSPVMTQKATEWVSSIDTALDDIKANYQPKLNDTRQLLNDNRYQDVINEVDHLLQEDDLAKPAYADIKAKFLSLKKTAQDKQAENNAKLNTQKQVTAATPHVKSTIDLSKLNNLQEVVSIRKHLVEMGVDEKVFSDEQLHKLASFAIANHHSSITMEDVEEFLGESH